MRIIFPSFIALLLLCNYARAQESDKYVSVTFQDILSRVVSRDKDSGAILIVKPKKDSSSKTVILSLSLTQGLEDETIVLLKYNNILNNGIYEKYRLRTDDAMREEMKRLERYQQALADKAKKREEQLALEITKKTSGILRYGMTVAEAEAIKGKPVSSERVPTQHITFTLIPGTGSYASHGYEAQLVYPDMTLYFMDGNLWGLADIPKAGITDITLDKGTGNKTLTPEKFKDLMRTAVPMSVFEYSAHQIPYGDWYKGSFHTIDGIYTFSLGLGGVNYLTTPGGTGTYFKFTE